MKPCMVKQGRLAGDGEGQGRDPPVQGTALRAFSVPWKPLSFVA